MIPLLSGCVPDLKLDCCVVQADGLCEEGRCKREGGVTRQERAGEAIPTYLHHCIRGSGTQKPSVELGTEKQPARTGGVCLFVHVSRGLQNVQALETTLGKGRRRDACLHLAISGALSEEEYRGQETRSPGET